MLLCTLSSLLVLPPMLAKGEPPPSPVASSAGTRSRSIAEQTAQITMRILRTQARLADVQEALGASRTTLPSSGLLAGSLNVDELLAISEREVDALEKLLDSGRGHLPESGLATANGWSNAALLQVPVERRLFQDDSDRSAALLQLADALRQRKLWEGALSYYERLLPEPSPKAPAALTGAIECRLRLGDFRGAVELFDAARTPRPGPGESRTEPSIPPEAMYLAGTAAFRRTDLPPDKRDRKALEILREVGPPFDIPAAYYRGAIFVRSGDIDVAIPEFKACDALSARSPRQGAQQEMCRLALARIDGDRWPWDGERYWYGRVTPESPHHREALYEQAWDHERAGSARLALALVDQIVGENPESRLAWQIDVLRAEILSHLGRYPDAVEAFDRIRRRASAMRDQLDRALGAERGPAAYLEWFTVGSDRSDLPPTMPSLAMRRARDAGEVEKALDIWKDLETATLALASARASSDRLDAIVSRDAASPVPAATGTMASGLAALAERARALDDALAIEEAKWAGKPPGEHSDAWQKRLGAMRSLRLRIFHLRARANRDERMLAELRGSEGGRPAAEIVEEQKNFADVERVLNNLRAEAQTTLGLQIHQTFLGVRSELDRTILQSDRGIVEVALARTKDAESRVESLVFRRRFEASLPWREDRPEVLAVIENRGREAVAEDRRVREEAIAQLNDYVQRHEDDAFYTPQALSRLAELQVEGAEGAPSKGGARPGSPEGPKGCAAAVELHRRLAKGFPEYRQSDAVYFLAGYCLGEMGKPSEARQAYSDLVRKYPDSPHVPEAWVRIGDLGFEEGRPDSLRHAAEAYSKAAARRDHPLYEHAMYMLGWTQYRLDDLPRAVETLERLLDRELSARREFKEDLPSGAVNLLGSMLADPRWDGLARARAIFAGEGGHPYEAATYRRLADELFDQGRYVQAVDAYKLAIARAPWSPEAPRLQEHVILSWSREGRPQEEAAERAQLVAGYGESSEWSRRNQKAGVPPGEVRDLIEASLAQAAAALHAQARELARVGKREAAAAKFRGAAQAYAQILDGTPGVKGAEGLAVARAECTFGAGEYEAAARLFEGVRDTSGDPRFQREAARGAVRSREAEASRQQDAGMLQGPALPLPAPLRSLVSATDVLVARFPDDASAPVAAFRIGEVFHRYQDLTEARRRFEEVSVRWPGTEAARDAQGMDLAIRFQRAIDLLGQKRWSEAASIFQAIADEAPRHPLADKALYNAAFCQESDHHREAAAALYARVEADHPGSPHAPDALLRQAALAEAVFDFGKAAERYQALISRYPDSKQARDALHDRARSLEIVQRYEEAGLAFERYASLDPAPADAPATLLHAAEVFEKGAAWPRVVRTLQEFQRRYSRSGDAELLVVAILRAGRAEDALGHEAAAKAAFSRSVAEFDRRGLESRKNPAGAAAVAEARFRLAEPDLQRFDRTGLPSTSQSGALERALNARLAEMARLAGQYEKVKRYQSPDWSVAALYRQGYLSERFAHSLLEAPPPPEFRKAGQEAYIAEYKAQLAKFVLPYEAQADQAYAQAVRLAQEFRVESDWSRRAAGSLSQRRPEEFGHLAGAKGRFLPESPPRPEDEERAANSALARDDRDVSAMVRLANASLARGRIELATEILESAERIAPEDSRVWNAAGRADLARGARVQAEARWKRAVDLNPDDADALTNQGQLLVEAGDHAGAAAVLERAVRSAPGSAASWHDLGNAYDGLGRSDDARRARERAISLDASQASATEGSR
jgi:tetratricopeptide (TPR) repeat protein